ncbi:H(+)/Cl(-) exchange transporter ClcA [Klebsiella pneumoniae IS43]|uniref:H(+)/Cl(-) exchange transporter ClcA n=1 Tax=Klebsiella pneumoniae IS43 TaxID=1432552 RepID=W1DQR3_KLEPN|nr:H(+)/Cl(-) exchange transporter ClcA [Klebsiella pneumoniae IS43]
MVLGREGPMVQLGGNIGRMVLDVFPHAQSGSAAYAVGDRCGVGAFGGL